jgi:hypothetical protein
MCESVEASQTCAQAAALVPSDGFFHTFHAFTHACLILSFLCIKALILGFQDLRLSCTPNITNKQRKLAVVPTFCVENSGGKVQQRANTRSNLLSQRIQSPGKAPNEE